MCWGDNFWGQLGNGGIGAGWQPTWVDGLSAAIRLESGGFVTTTILVDRELARWGIEIPGWSPALVEGLPSVRRVAVGGLHSCALDFEGRLWCWGKNFFGGLGDGTLVDRLEPALVAGIDAADAVALGYGFTCVTRAGAVWCWGAGARGQLGNGAHEDELVPTKVLGIDDAVEISAREDLACVRRIDGSVWCWGEDLFEVGYNVAPVQLPGMNRTHGISAGEGHVCALDAESNVKCLGWNAFGQLGDGTTEPRSEPVYVSWPDP